jgi:hypothetical protein
MRRTSSRASPERRLRLAAIERARLPAERERSRLLVRLAPPAALTFFTVAEMRVIALASSPESVGYATSASTTVVSVRTLCIRTSLASAPARAARR